MPLPARYERTAGGEVIDSEVEFQEEQFQARMDALRWQGVI